MYQLLLKAFLLFIPWGIFAGVVLSVPYPESFAQANLNQILPFFAALFLALIFTFNIFLKNILLSLSLALGIIFLLILKALDALNIVTAILTIVATSLLVSYFKKGGKTKEIRSIKRIKNIRGNRRNRV